MALFQIFLIILFFVSGAGVFYAVFQASPARNLAMKRKPSGKPIKHILTGGGFGFLCGVCVSALMWMNSYVPGDPRNLEVLLLWLMISVFSGLFGAGWVVIEVIRTEKYQRLFDRIYEESQGSKKAND